MLFSPQTFVRPRTKYLGLCVLLLSAAGSLTAQSAPPAKPDADRFVDQLLAKMTLAEKLGQMSQMSYKDVAPATAAAATRTGNVGSFLFVTDPALIDRLQHIAVDDSRLHIPLIFGFDVIHGYHTIFPIPLAVASSWDPALAERVQSMSAREASAGGINWAFAPMVDIAHDARWGRIMEGAGEDPFLGSAMAAAQVRGFQGPTLGTPNRILACAKHFAAYGAGEGGRDYDAANISDEQLNNVYLPPFHAAEQAGAGCFMSAYIDLQGVPASGNRMLLHDVLRDQWGFRGMVVSDWASVESLTNHGFASGPEDAAARGLHAGVDMEMVSHVFRDNLPKALKDGQATIADLDNAVRNILRIKYELGLFTNPYSARTLTAAEQSEQQQVALHAAEQSAVLLRNEGHLLPLAHALHSLAVIGPLADSKPDTMGSWSLAGHVDPTITVFTGLQHKLGASTTVTYAKGVEIIRPSTSIFDGQFPEPAPTLHTPEEKAAAFAHAIDLVRSSDAAIVVLGEANNMSGERASRASLDLPGDQQKLLEAAVATGKPIVLVLLNGRPLNIAWAAQHVPSILEAWYPGTEGGAAIANLLFGDANPGGKLPVSWPRTAGQEPFYYSRNLTQDREDDPDRYWDTVNTPLYPFGFGLSYSTFTLGPIHLDAASMPTNGVLTVSVPVTNSGNVAGDDVLQLYTHQRAGTASRPARELKGFERIHLRAGETRVVTLTLRAADLAFWSPQTHHFGVEPGVFDLWAGDDSTAANHANFTVLP
ncbi:MAG: beta-glucosidase BglX [Acidobacteriota bacterium]